MKSIALLLLVTTGSAFASVNDIKVVYGEDNRKDLYQVTNANYKTWAQSTAAMIPQEIVSLKNLGINGAQIAVGATLSSEMNVCTTERFSSQYIGPVCSGFLVSPTKLVTAGHCYIMSAPTPKEACARFKWVFNFGLDTADRNLATGYSKDDIYSCKNVVVAKMDKFNDFAVIELDRPVVGHNPLPVRQSGEVAIGEELVVIGHPSGLPTKVADDAYVSMNPAGTKFVADLDTFQGNSGSAVFNAKSGMIEGILVQGRTDYVPRDPNDESSCLIVNKCERGGGACTDGANQQLPGEVVTKISSILKYIK